MMQKPDVEHIDGLSPAISIEQKNFPPHNPALRPSPPSPSAADYLRLLWARVGIPYSPATGLPIEAQQVSQMVDRVMALNKAATTISSARRPRPQGRVSEKSSPSGRKPALPSPHRRRVSTPSRKLRALDKKSQARPRGSDIAVDADSGRAHLLHSASSFRYSPSAADDGARRIVAVALGKRHHCVDHLAKSCCASIDHRRSKGLRPRPQKAQIIVTFVSGRVERGCSCIVFCSIEMARAVEYARRPAFII